MHRSFPSSYINHSQVPSFVVTRRTICQTKLCASPTYSAATECSHRLIAMASLHSISTQSALPPSKMKPKCRPVSKSSQTPVFSREQKQRTKSWVLRSAVEELDVIPVHSTDSTDHQEGVVVGRVEREGGLDAELVSGLGANEGRLSFEGAGEFQGFSSSSSSSSVGDGAGNRENEDMEKLLDRTINATIVLAAGTFAITKLVTIDHDYWHVSHSSIASDRFFYFFVQFVICSWEYLRNSCDFLG